MVTTPPTPRTSPTIFRAVSFSFIHTAANTAPNMGDIELKMASMAAGSTSAATE